MIPRAQHIAALSDSALHQMEVPCSSIRSSFRLASSLYSHRLSAALASSYISACRLSDKFIDNAVRALWRSSTPIHLRHRCEAGVVLPLDLTVTRPCHSPLPPSSTSFRLRQMLPCVLLSVPRSVLLCVLVVSCAVVAICMGWVKAGFGQPCRLPTGGGANEWVCPLLSFPRRSPASLSLSHSDLDKEAINVSGCTNLSNLPPAFSSSPSVAVPASTHRVEKRICVEQRETLTLLLIVFTMNRLLSLQRLIQSVLTSDYSNFSRVNLRIRVDHSDQQESVRQWLATLDWTHGSLELFYAPRPLGLKRNVLEAWNPTTLEEVAVFLEDDVEVSPVFTHWLRIALRTYYAIDDRLWDTPVMGISLYSPRWSERMDAPFVVSLDSAIYNLQLPCSWGALYLPGPWRDFVVWQAQHDGFDPLVPSLPSINAWRQVQSWKKYLIRFMVDSGRFMIYFNRPDNRSYSTNHIEPGVNFMFQQAKSAEAGSTDTPNLQGAARSKLVARYTLPLVRPSDETEWLAEVERQKVPLSRLLTLDIFEQPVRLSDLDGSVPLLPPSVWTSFTRFTVFLIIRDVVRFAATDMMMSVFHWQTNRRVAEVIIQLPPGIEFACPQRQQVHCRVNSLPSKAVDSYMWPVAQLQTTAGLLVDHRLRPPQSAIDVLFYTWQSHPDQLISFWSFSRSFIRRAAPWDSWLPYVGADPDLTVVSTAAAMMDTRYLDLYSGNQSSDSHLQLIRSIQRRQRGEDVAVNCLITAHTGRPAVLVHANVESAPAELIWHAPLERYINDLKEAARKYGGTRALPLRPSNIFVPLQRSESQDSLGIERIQPPSQSTRTRILYRRIV